MTTDLTRHAFDAAYNTLLCLLWATLACTSIECCVHAHDDIDACSHLHAKLVILLVCACNAHI